MSKIMIVQYICLLSGKIYTRSKSYQIHQRGNIGIIYLISTKIMCLLMRIDNKYF